MDEFVGRPLVELLRTKQRRDESSLTQLAMHLEVGHSYLSQLFRGIKPLSSVSEQFLRACARYLEIPVVLVYLLSGRLQSNDFFSAPMLVDTSIDSALELIGQSRFACEASVDVEMLRMLPNAAKLFVVLLYERAESVLLLPPRVRRGEVEAVGQFSIPFDVRLNKPQ